MLIHIDFNLNRRLSKNKKVNISSINPKFKSNENTLKLPKLELITFSGANLHERLSFRDIFIISTYNNELLSRGMKLQYSKSAATGEDFRIIQSISIVYSNYEVA